MKTISSLKILRDTLLKIREGKSIGFVPTMGFLHAGHLELVRQARKKCDVVVVSIFVNPLQFGKGEDFSRYPRDEKRDLKLLKNAGVDFVFLPSATDVYNGDFQTHVDVKNVSQGLCGASRPGHFRGVATIVLKLFNMVRPHVAFFGKKDFQQLAVVKAMVRDLNLSIEIVGVPIVREVDGLALSSRNVYLNPEERQWALGLSQGLKAVRAQFLQRGQLTHVRAEKIFRKYIPDLRQVRMDYFSCVDKNNLKQFPRIKKGQTLVAAAVFFGKTRLIDNVEI